jgi:DNA adenine methylase
VTIATRRLRPPIKRHGGKAYLAPKIVPLLPSHRTYVEPFLGGGSVLLNKPKAEREVAGDLDSGLINLWQVLRSKNPGLFLSVATIDYTEGQFNNAIIIPDQTQHPVDRAIGYLVRNRFSRGGLGKTFAWSDRLRGGKPGDANAWDTIRAELPAIADRVRDVVFRNGLASGLVNEFGNDPDALIYADPPYTHETRTARAAYGEFEMTTTQHALLLGLLNHCRAKVVLSGYRCDLYDVALSGWERHEFDMPNHSGQGRTKQRRVECVWIKA